MKRRAEYPLSRRIVESYLPDILENIPRRDSPNLLERVLGSSKDALPLVRRLIPIETQDALLAETEQLSQGAHRAQIVVGTQRDGTRHPHDFIVNKHSGMTDLLFVDPEHNMGKVKWHDRIPLKGIIRPKVVTLFGVRFTQGEEIPEISLIRFRAAAIREGRLLKMQAQNGIASQLLETGALPEALQDKEHEVTVRFNVRKNRALVQSRLASPNDLNHFLLGEKSAPVLEGKIATFNLLIQHFVRHLRDNKFAPLLRKRSQTANT